MSITETARYLQSLRTRHERIDELPPALMPPDLAAGYRAQAALVDGLCAHWGGTTAGYKVALTNPSAQRMLGVPYPVFGRLFSERLHESGITLRATDYVIRLIEVEIAFQMASDVPAIEGGPQSPVHRRAHRSAVSGHRAGRASLRGPRSVHAGIVRRGQRHPRRLDPRRTRRPVAPPRPRRAADAASRQRRGETDRLGGQRPGSPARGHGMAGQRVAAARALPCARRLRDHGGHHRRHLSRGGGGSAGGGLPGDRPRRAGLRVTASTAHTHDAPGAAASNRRATSRPPRVARATYIGIVA